MISTELQNLLNAQAEIEKNAESLAQALCLWAKNVGWEGSHKWFGREWQDAVRRVKGIGKLVQTYLQLPYSIPAAGACACEATDLEDAFNKWTEAVETAQEGWVAVANQAEQDGAMDISEFCDRYMSSNVRELKKLHRFQALLSISRGNTAALLMFDEERK